MMPNAWIEAAIISCKEISYILIMIIRTCGVVLAQVSYALFIRKTSFDARGV